MATSSYFLSIFTAACGTLLFGYHMAELNAPEAVIRCKEINSDGMSVMSVPECIDMTVSQFGFVNSIFAIGGLMGALGSGRLADKYGRTRLQLFNTVPFVLGGLILTFSVDVWSMAFGRWLSGVGCGSAAVVVPLYIHEITSAKMQGVMAATTQISVNFGILLTQTLGLFWSDPNHWRWILFISALVPALQFFLFGVAVESPKWLVSTRQDQRAKDALIALRSTVDVSEELNQLYQQQHGGAGSMETETLLADEERAPPKQSGGGKVDIWTFLTSPVYRRQLVVVLGIMCIQQLSGINGIVMYGVAVLRDLFPSSSGLINVFISFLNLAITASAASFFGRVGRKPFILGSIAGMAFFAFFLGVGIVYSIPILSALSTVFFVSSFSIGLGPLPWAVAAEVVEFKAVGAAQSLALAANWIGTFAIGYGFPVCAAWIGIGQTFWVFTVINLCSIAFIIRYMPETKDADGPEEVWKRFDGLRRD